MNVAWIRNMFGVEKPIIAMCHLQAMPSDPGYDVQKGMDWVIEMARHDLRELLNGGVDAVMFSNEFSRPYLTKTKSVTTAAMAAVISELKPDIKVPFGVNVLWDPFASVDLAAATGALFIREIMSGVYASDFGLWNTSAGEVVRHKKEVGREDLKLLYNIVPEAAKYLADRPIEEIAKTTVFNHQADALCVSGLTAGSVTDSQVLSRVKKSAPDTAVFCNTGCCVNNVEIQLSVADGAVVGTCFKTEGKFENMVDGKRVKEFMDKVREIRTC